MLAQSETQGSLPSSCGETPWDIEDAYSKEKGGTGKWPAQVWVTHPSEKKPKYHENNSEVLSCRNSLVVPTSSDCTGSLGFLIQVGYEKRQLEEGAQSGAQECHGSRQRHPIRERTNWT